MFWQTGVQVIIPNPQQFHTMLKTQQDSDACLMDA